MLLTSDIDTLFHCLKAKLRYLLQYSTAVVDTPGNSPDGSTSTYQIRQSDQCLVGGSLEGKNLL